MVHYDAFRFFFQIINNEFHISFFCDIFVNIDIEIVILFRGFGRTRLNMFQIDTSPLDEKILVDLSFRSSLCSVCIEQFLHICVISQWPFALFASGNQNVFVMMFLD